MKRSFITSGPGFEVIKLFSCQIELSLNLKLQINIKTATIIFMFRLSKPVILLAHKRRNSNKCKQLLAFLARLSRRLPMLRRLSVVGVVRRRRRPQCSHILFSETAWPIKVKFYVEPP